MVRCQRGLIGNRPRPNGVTEEGLARSAEPLHWPVDDPLGVLSFSGRAAAGCDCCNDLRRGGRNHILRRDGSFCAAKRGDQPIARIMADSCAFRAWVCGMESLGQLFPQWRAACRSRDISIGKAAEAEARRSLMPRRIY